MSPERSEGAQQSRVGAITRIASARKENACRSTGESEHSAVTSRGLRAIASIPQTWIMGWGTHTAPRKRVGKRHTCNAACLIVRENPARGMQAAQASARAYSKRSGRAAARKKWDSAFASIRVGLVCGDGCKTGAQRHEQSKRA